MTRAITVRASSFGALLDCAYRWEGAQLLGIRRPSSGAAHLGTCLHTATGAFDRERIDGTEITPDDAAGLFVRALHHPEEDVDWGGDSIKSAERIGIKLTTKYCGEWAPRWTYAAVELTCKPMEIATEHGNIILTGTMDRARVMSTAGGLAVRDVKSGRRAVDKTGRAVTKGHALQVGVYELLTADTLGRKVTAPGGIIGLQTTEDARIGEAEITNAREQLVGAPGKTGLIEMAARILHSGLFTPNPQSRLCAEKYCARWPTCPYHD